MEIRGFTGATGNTFATTDHKSKYLVMNPNVWIWKLQCMAGSAGRRMNCDILRQRVHIPAYKM